MTTHLESLVRKTLTELGLNGTLPHGESLGHFSFRNEEYRVFISPLEYKGKYPDKHEFQLIAEVVRAPTALSSTAAGVRAGLLPSAVLYVFSPDDLLYIVTKCQQLDPGLVEYVPKVLAERLRQRCPTLAERYPAPPQTSANATFQFMSALLKAQGVPLDLDTAKSEVSNSLALRILVPATPMGEEAITLQLEIKTPRVESPTMIAPSPIVTWRLGGQASKEFTFNVVVMFTQMEDLCTVILCHLFLEYARVLFLKLGYSQLKQVGNRLEIFVSTKLSDYLAPAIISIGKHYGGVSNGFIMETQEFNSSNSTTISILGVNNGFKSVQEWISHCCTH